MKLLFLFRVETDLPRYFSFYDFLPYNYGPYSFYADNDLLDLREKNYVTKEQLSIDQQRIDDVDLAVNNIPANARNEINNIMERYRQLEDQDLVDYVYETYPLYTTLSELPKSTMPRPKATPAIYTMGYEGISIDHFLKILIEKGIRRIIDIRKNPLSRKFGFSKRSLKKYGQKTNVDYIHFPELGIPSEKRTSLDDKASYEALFNEYETNILEENKEKIRQVSQHLKDRPSVLLCFEEDPFFCHRSRLADQIQTSSSLDIQHIQI